VAGVKDVGRVVCIDFGGVWKERKEKRWGGRGAVYTAMISDSVSHGEK